MQALAQRLLAPTATAAATVGRRGAALVARAVGCRVTGGYGGAAWAHECVARTTLVQRSATTLTAQQKPYQHIQRGNFSKVEGSDLQVFEDILGSSGVITEQADVDRYNQDWMNKFRGQGVVVLRPKTTEEVAAILRHCNQRRLAVSTQGGNTGLVGGSVPLFDEIILSTELMNNIISVDEVSRILTCQAGCVLEQLNNHLDQYNLMMPLDLGAKGSCQIGGNVSTNAGGLRFLRYGSLHGTVLGLEAVLADGTVLNTLSGLRKDNTGYDLKQLFIGSEGTLGVVTGVALEAVQKPAAVNVAFLACESYQQLQDTFKAAKQHLGEILSAFEFLDDDAMKVTTANLGLNNPLTQDAPFYILIETHGSVQEHDFAKLEGFLETVMAEELVNDGTVAQDEAQAQALWGIRERITEALQHDGTVYKYDISLPLPELYSLVEAMRARVSDFATRCVGYGHVGDGNLHLNITSSTPNDELFDLIEPFVYEFTAQHKGSISAEHGLGLMKPHHMHYSKPAEAIQLMKQIKAMMDPHGILNPYKTLA